MSHQTQDRGGKNAGKTLTLLGSSINFKSRGLRILLRNTYQLYFRSLSAGVALKSIVSFVPKVKGGQYYETV